MKYLISWHSLCITLTNKLKIRLHPVGLTNTGINRERVRKMTTGRMRNAGRTTNWITASVLMLVIGSFGLFADARVRANELPPLEINTSSTATAPDICVLCTQSFDVICANATKESLIEAAGEILYN